MNILKTVCGTYFKEESSFDFHRTVFNTHERLIFQYANIHIVSQFCFKHSFI